MRICGLRILPPFAIARLGSAGEPMDNYTLADDPSHPLGFRQITPLPSFRVVQSSGEIEESEPASEITFTDSNKKIRPVAPFLEVFAVIEDQDQQTLQPLDAELLKKFGMREAAWRVTVANRKVYRRTGCLEDVVEATTDWFIDHKPHDLEGHSKNFVSPNKFIRFGTVRFIKPNEKFPQYRLRFTPAHGLIYGPKPDPKKGDPEDPLIPPARAIYDRDKPWFELGSDDKPVKNETVPPSLYAISSPAPSWLNDNIAISRGYLDDTCDGFAEFRLVLATGEEHIAVARICSAPPAVVPDSLFVRTLADDLDQVIYGPKFYESYEKTRSSALDIVRRAYETVRFMNVAVMNGNDVGGRSSLSLDSMPEEEAADTERAIRPVMSPATVDTFTILALHEHVYTALLGGAAPWFVNLLRQPDEVADFTDRGRRKMPALMCGADNSYLALTHRQINAIRRAATEALFQDEALEKPPVSPYVQPLNASARLFPPDVATRRSVHVRYEAGGNPLSSRPITSVANCCPGLEVDFRAVWRRVFKGIVLREYDNLVMEVDEATKERLPIQLHGHRLLRVRSPKEAWEFTTPIRGPAPSDSRGEITLTTPLNPHGRAPLEWSNALAFLLMNFQGETVECDFTLNPEKLQQPISENPKNYRTFPFEVRNFFADDTAVISRELASEGELTQGLCSPWQNDYRECSCYYWASARPDYVDVKPGEDGLSHGYNWFQKDHAGEYVPDDYQDERLVLYDDLFQDWERWLRFQIQGRDVKRKQKEREEDSGKTAGAGA